MSRCESATGCVSNRGTLLVLEGRFTARLCQAGKDDRCAEKCTPHGRIALVTASIQSSARLHSLFNSDNQLHCKTLSVATLLPSFCWFSQSRNLEGQLHTAYSLINDLHQRCASCAEKLKVDAQFDRQSLMAAKGDSAEPRTRCGITEHRRQLEHLVYLPLPPISVSFCTVLRSWHILAHSYCNELLSERTKANKPA
eukprot:6477069-Amphidinium_carterae.1